MGETLAAAVVPGLALGGVLAVTAVVAATAGHGGAPHLGVGALPGVAALAAGRTLTISPVVATVAAVVVTAVVALAAQRLDVRVRTARSPLATPPWLADVAVLGLLVGVGSLLRPALAVDLPVGPLGGAPSTGAGATGAVLGLAGAFALRARRLRALPASAWWALAGTVIAVAAVPAAGVLGGASQGLAAAFAVADPAGLALRAAAVAVVARRDPLAACGWGLGVGLAETLVRTVSPLSGAALLPAIAAAAAGLLAAAGRATPARATAR